MKNQWKTLIVGKKKQHKDGMSLRETKQQKKARARNPVYRYYTDEQVGNGKEFQFKDRVEESKPDIIDIVETKPKKNVESYVVFPEDVR